LFGVERAVFQLRNARAEDALGGHVQAQLHGRGGMDLGENAEPFLGEFLGLRR
jgi:hypothetical protein